MKVSKFPGQLNSSQSEQVGLSTGKRGIHDSATPDIYPSPPKLLQLLLPLGTRRKPTGTLHGYLSRISELNPGVHGWP